LVGRKLYAPTEQGAEAIIRRYLDKITSYRPKDKKDKVEKMPEQNDD